jgi:hypothetical protein
VDYKHRGENKMDRSNWIAGKDCEGVKPEMRKICCDSLMLSRANYDKTTCWKYGDRTDFPNYANIFQKNMLDCVHFKRDGKCPLANLM